MNSVKKAAGILVNVILWAIIVVAALFAFTTLATKDSNSVSTLAGYTPMMVKSDSMQPTFSKGDLIIIKTCDPAKLEVGDIICFHAIIENQYALNTHRIASIADNGSYRSYVTRGDNNLIEDQHMIVDSDIVGQYQGRVPVLGSVLSFLSTSLGFLLVIVLPMLAFFCYQAYHLITVGIKLRKASMLEAREEADRGSDVEKLRAEAEQARAEAEAAMAELKRLKEQQETEAK